MIVSLWSSIIPYLPVGKTSNDTQICFSRSVHRCVYTGWTSSTEPIKNGPCSPDRTSVEFVCLRVNHCCDLPRVFATPYIGLFWTDALVCPLRLWIFAEQEVIFFPAQDIQYGCWLAEQESNLHPTSLVPLSSKRLSLNVHTTNILYSLGLCLYLVLMASKCLHIISQSMWL